MTYSRFRGLSCFAALLSLALTVRADANSKFDEVLKQLEQVHSFSGVKISPDGKWVAWIAEGPAKADSVYLLDWKKPGAKAKRVVLPDASGDPQASDIAWAPDSRQIAFLSRGDKSKTQIYTAYADGAKARISNLDGYIADLRWSPDGKRIAFLYAEHGGSGGPLEAVPAQLGEIGSDIRNQRLSTLSANGGEARQISPANLNIYEYDWSPDGAAFAAVAAPGPADNNWWTAKLYTVAADSGQMKVIYSPPVDRQIAAPHWSPDGSKIGFLAGLMSDEGFDGGDIYVVSSGGGNARNVTEDLKATPTGLRWRDDQSILYTEALEGGGAIALFKLTTGETEVLWEGAEALHEDGNFPNLSVAKDGVTSATIRSTWAEAPEITAGRIGDWKAVTEENALQKPLWGKAESLLWESDGKRVQGWLLYPENFDASRRYPMVVSVHGGPSSERSASWPSGHFDVSVMASLGYFVLFPNPRGSYGEGEAFTRANMQDFGGGDLKDILAGVDAAVKKAPIDEARIGVTGWSYGGYMTMWTVTQTNRFRAAVAGAGIADWLSYYGENSIDAWMIPFFGASVYDNPAVYAKSSPITFIKQVKTPTLVVVGERDGECPAPQSFEFWHALKAENVPTKLVVYAGEGHSFHDPKDRLDVLRRTAEWFETYLK
ncbi:MAG: S9 family peptidase [Acidobacteriota bacterium]|nr:S9 family peptidase [Acidobacteriota bacterium]